MTTLYQDFSSRLQMLSELVKIDKSCNDVDGKTVSDKINLVSIIRESLSILPVSYYEFYLKLLISEFIDKLNSSDPQCIWKNLPENIRRTHLYESNMSLSKKLPKFTTFQQHEEKIFDDLNKISKIVLSPFISHSSYKINIEPFKKTDSNPNAETTNKLFNKIGVENVFSDSELISLMLSYDPKFTNRESITRELNNIVEHRNVIAHGSSALEMTINELESNIQFLDNLGNTLQIVCNRQFEEIFKNQQKTQQTTQ